MIVFADHLVQMEYQTTPDGGAIYTGTCRLCQTVVTSTLVPGDPDDLMIGWKDAKAMVEHLQARHPEELQQCRS